MVKRRRSKLPQAPFNQKVRPHPRCREVLDLNRLGKRPRIRPRDRSKRPRAAENLRAHENHNPVHKAGGKEGTEDASPALDQDARHAAPAQVA